MSDIHDEKLDAMLKSRRLESASPGLADQIILKAQRIPQNQTMTLAEWLRQVFAEFHLPRPAYVLACTLVFGLVVGFYTPLDTTPADDADPVYIQSFLYADEAIL
jgi:hypothetical protein